MQEYYLNVLPPDAGKRVDIFVADYSKQQGLGLSRQAVQRLIAEGNIVLKPSSPVKPHYKVKSADEIIVRIEEKRQNNLEPEEPEDIPLEIIYEDNDLAVINKPAGLVVHPAPGNFKHTLVNALLYRFKNLSDIDPQRPGIVHRLDKDTSGLLVIAKNNTTHLALSKQFSEHSIKRKYAAVVSGRVEFDENIIDVPIGRHPYKRENMAVSFNENTRYAKTYYRTLKREKDSSLLELEPFTGRTHQLRVHLAFIGHPILGDTKYGKDKGFGRLALHAKYLGFIHPGTDKFVEFSTDMPDEFVKFLEGK